MKDILIEIDRLAEEELDRANKIHPPFHSDHEGKAVIQEEIEEALDCLKNIDESYEGLWNAIKDVYKRQIGGRYDKHSIRNYRSLHNLICKRSRKGRE